MDNERVLVTGGAGFIGSHLCERLIELGHSVFVVDDLSSGKKEYVPKEAKLFRASVQNRKLMKKIARKVQPTVVFHLAAQKDVRNSVKDPVHDAELNIMGTLYTLDAVRELPGVRFIAASSAAVYSPAAPLPVNEKSALAPKSPYGTSKCGMEHYVSQYANLFPISGASIRPANVYGPRQSLEGAGVVTIFIKNLLAGKESKINGSGEQTRDFVYVGDVVESMLRLMRVDWCGEMNISTNTETTVNELYATLQEIIGTEIEPMYDEPQAGDLLQSRLDATLASQEIGWRAQTLLQDGLQTTVEWFRNN